MQWLTGYSFITFVMAAPGTVAPHLPRPPMAGTLQGLLFSPPVLCRPSSLASELSREHCFRGTGELGLRIAWRVSFLVVCVCFVGSIARSLSSYILFVFFSFIYSLSSLILGVWFAMILLHLVRSSANPSSASNTSKSCCCTVPLSPCSPWLIYCFLLFVIVFYYFIYCFILPSFILSISYIYLNIYFMQALSLGGFTLIFYLYLIILIYLFF